MACERVAVSMSLTNATVLSAPEVSSNWAVAHTLTLAAIKVSCKSFSGMVSSFASLVRIEACTTGSF